MIKKIYHKIRLYLKFPHIWVVLLIIILAIITVILSFNFENQSVSSIFSNIFAGLVTGLIIYLISGVKQIYIFKLSNKLKWLKNLQNMIHDYKKIYGNFFDKKAIINDVEINDYIYDVASKANNINSEILRSKYEKTITFSPIKYCKKEYEYDAEMLIDEYNKLHDNLWSLDLSKLSILEILNYFQVIDEEINHLALKLTNDISNIEYILNIIDRSVI